MVVTTKNLSLELPGCKCPVFKDLSLELCEGETGLVTGPPGSGKTMLGLTLCGFLPLWVGSWKLVGNIKLFGRILEQGETPMGVSIILENPYSQISGMKKSVRYELAFPLECIGTDPVKMFSTVERYAEELGVRHLLDRTVRSLSGGELQRVLIAESMITQPRFIFLDRPLTEIDQEFRTPLLNNIIHHIYDVGGAALFAEDPWLLPENLRFNKEFNLGSEEEQMFNTKDFSPELYHKNHISHNDNLLIVDSLTFAYDRINSVFNNLSFSLGSGDISFIAGANGAGKTTLAKCIAGILKPSSGSIVIDGRQSETMREWEIMSSVGLTFQNPDYQLCRRSVREELHLAGKWGNPAGKLVEVLGLDALLEHHPLELTQAEKKRLGMALACGGRRKVLILDEPSQYQDAEGFNRIVEAVEMCRTEGKGILIITHDPRFFTAFRGAGVIHLFREENA